MADRPSGTPELSLSTLLHQHGATLESVSNLLRSEQNARDLFKGKRLPTLYEATVIGAYTGLDPAVLTQEEPPSVGVSLRLGRIAGVRDVSDVIDHAAKILNADRLSRDWGYGEEPRRLDGFAVSNDRFDKKAGQTTAVRLRAYLQVKSTEPIRDLVGFVESLGHAVERRPLPGDVHGISLPDTRDLKRWIVLVNSKDNWGRQRFTLAHELSHTLYGDSGQVIVDRVEAGDVRPERIADSFARHLLLPDEAVLLKMQEHKITSRTIRDACALVADIMMTYGVSRDATIIALRECKRHSLSADLTQSLSTMNVSHIMNLAGLSLEWGRLESAHKEDSPSGRLTDQVLAAYQDGRLSLETVADVINAGDIRKTKADLVSAGWPTYEW